MNMEIIQFIKEFIIVMFVIQIQQKKYVKNVIKLVMGNVVEMKQNQIIIKK